MRRTSQYIFLGQGITRNGPGAGETVHFLIGLFILILAGIVAGTIAEVAKARARRGAST